MEDNMNSAIGITDILIDAINKKYDNIRDLNSLNVNLKEEDYEAMIPVIDSIIEDENNSIGKLQQLIDLLSGSEEDIEEGKQDTIEIIDGNEFVESFNKMKKKLILSENFDNVIDDVQAVADPVFVGANKEHDENKKKYEDAMEENKKAAEDTIPDEGDTGKDIKSKELKAMHLSEDLFSDYSNARPGATKALELVDEGVANSEDMLDELIRYLPDNIVKEFIDYYAENFLGIFEDDYLEESCGKKKLNEDDEGLNWRYWYSLFDMIVNEYLPDTDLVNSKVESLYNTFSFNSGMKEAYRRWCDTENLEESCGKKKLEEATHFPNMVSDMYKEDPHNLLDLLIDWLPNATLDKFGREIQEYNNFNSSDDLNESIQLGESFVAEWWGQVDGDTPQEVAKRYNLSVKPLKQKQDEILYKFEGSLEDFSRAIDDGYFYALMYQQDAGHSDDINSLLNESIQSKIAKEQIKRFTEGKMPKNWNVDSYLNKLTEKKHITKKEAKSLKEWYSKNK